MYSLKAYLEDCYFNAPNALWDFTGLARIASLRIQTPALGHSASLLHGDANVLIAKWFIESIYDLESCDEEYALPYSRTIVLPN